MKVLIMFPNTFGARAVCVRLIETGHSVSLYCPKNVDRVRAGNLKQELEIFGSEQDRLRSKEDSFSFHTGSDMDSFDFLGKP